MSKYLIINADDFGISHEENMAVAELYQEGKITSVSVMAGAHAYEEAVDIIKKLHMDSVGVHLYVASEYQKEDCIYKLSGMTCSDKLLNGEIFPPKFTLSEDNLLAVCDESKAQIEKVIGSGINISHLDNHMYALWPARQPDFLEYACRLCVEYKIPAIRLCAKIKEQDKYFSPVYSGRINRLYARSIIGSYSLKSSDYVFLMSQGRDSDFSDDTMLHNFRNFLARIPDGITEMHFHPAIPDDELKLHHPWWEERAAEYRLFKNNDIKAICREYDIELISYRDLLMIKSHNLHCSRIVKKFTEKLL